MGVRSGGKEAMTMCMLFDLRAVRNSEMKEETMNTGERRWICIKYKQINQKLMEKFLSSASNKPSNHR